MAAFVVGQGLYLWAKAVNPFFSSVARIQTERGQTVCREGPTGSAVIPATSAGVLFGLATPVVLGSYWALIPQAAAVVLLVGRTFLEDRMLKKDLLWYDGIRQDGPIPARAGRLVTTRRPQPGGF